MPNSEFDLINQYFKTSFKRDDVSLGIGDDCAILNMPKNTQLVTTTDTLIEGVHFPKQTSPEDIAYKAVAVNLSDLAAMGAIPAWLSLAVTLPEPNHQWLKSFTDGLHKILERYGMQLIGGDTTKGDLSITIQAMGFVNEEHVLLRENAKPDDLIYVSGSLGDAALGLAMIQNQVPVSDDSEYFINRLNRPTPRIELGQALTELCGCAIDLSDGLFSDIKHILNRSSCGAIIDLQKIPYSNSMLNYLTNTKLDFHAHELMTGDDYELCFTVPPEKMLQIQTLSETLDIPLTYIGVINKESGLVCKNGAEIIETGLAGFNHFS